MKHSEIWKSIDGFEDYMVSSAGRMKSLKFQKVRMMALTVDKSTGYVVVTLRNSGCRKILYVHRIVAENFLEKPENLKKCCVNHINFDRTDNRVENLEWTSFAGNINHSLKAGRYPCQKGENNRSAKLSNDDVDQIRELYSSGKFTQAALAKKFNIHKDYICRVINKKSRG